MTAGPCLVRAKAPVPEGIRAVAASLVALGSLDRSAINFGSVTIPGHAARLLPEHRDTGDRRDQSRWFR